MSFSRSSARAPTLTLFPYTTLFRSQAAARSLCEGDRGPSALGRSGLPVPDRRRRPGGERVGQRAVHAAMHRHQPVLRLERSEEHTSELQSHVNLVCRLLLEKKKKK